MQQAFGLPLSRSARWSLLALLLVAAAVRIHGLSFGLPSLYDPDEPLFVLNALKLLREHTLNPGWFGHPGTTTLYALAMVDLSVFAFGIITGRWTDPASFAHAVYGNSAILWLPDRVFILTCGLLCVFLTFSVGRRLFGNPTGLVAAALLAIDPLHIKYSQIVRTDVHATVFILLCVLASIDIVRRGARTDYAAAGFLLGFSLATKWPAGLVLIVIVGACLTRISEHPNERSSQFRRLLLACAIGFAALLAASPYLALDFSAVMQDLHDEARPFHLGATGHGFLSNASWYVSNCFDPALGIAGLVASLVGIGLALRQNRMFAFSLAPFMVVFFVLISSQALIWDRWSVPLLPFVSITAAVGLVAAYRTVKRLTSGLPASLFVGGAALVVGLPLAATVQARATERVNDTRRLSTDWIREHVPPGSRVLSEYLALDLLNKGWRMMFPIGDGGCVDVDANVNAKISYTKISAWRGKRPVIDLGTMNPAMLASCRADYAVLVDYDRYLAEADSHRYTQEISNYQRLIASGTIVATIRPQPGWIGGYIVRIVKLDKMAR